MSKWWCCSGEENPLDYLFVGSIYNERLGSCQGVINELEMDMDWLLVPQILMRSVSESETRADRATRGSRLDAQLWMTIRLYDAAV